MTLSSVTSRISEIQQQLAQYLPAIDTTATTSTGTTTGSADGASATAFADQLGRAMTTTPDSTSGSSAGDAVVADAKKYLGVPYRWGGTDPSTGLDCSGLVQRVYSDLGYSLPRVSGDQAQAGTPVASLAQAQPGDILAFGSPVHHVAIYIGNGEMIQAPHTGEDVQISKVADFGEPVAAIRRIIPADASSTISARTATSAVSSSTPYAATFEAASARTGVPASLLSAVAKQESGYNARAVSPAGAEGLMQLMPGTARSLGVSDPMNATQSINGAADYLKTLLNQFGSTKLALAAYNAGPGAVLKYNGVPPYPETQNYVRNVLSSMGAAS